MKRKTYHAHEPRTWSNHSSSEAKQLSDFVRHKWVSIEKDEFFENLVAMRTSKLRLLLLALRKSTAVFLREMDVQENSAEVVCHIASSLRLCPLHPHVTPLDHVILSGYRVSDKLAPETPDHSYLKPFQMRSAECSTVSAYPNELSRCRMFRYLMNYVMMWRLPQRLMRTIRAWVPW